MPTPNFAAEFSSLQTQWNFFKANDGVPNRWRTEVEQFIQLFSEDQNAQNRLKAIYSNYNTRDFDGLFVNDGVSLNLFSSNINNNVFSGSYSHSRVDPVALWNSQYFPKVQQWIDEQNAQVEFVTPSLSASHSTSRSVSNSATSSMTSSLSSTGVYGLSTASGTGGFMPPSVFEVSSSPSYSSSYSPSYSSSSSSSPSIPRSEDGGGRDTNRDLAIGGGLVGGGILGFVAIYCFVKKCLGGNPNRRRGVNSVRPTRVGWGGVNEDRANTALDLENIIASRSGAIQTGVPVTAQNPSLPEVMHAGLPVGNDYRGVVQVGVQYVDQQRPPAYNPEYDVNVAVVPANAPRDPESRPLLPGMTRRGGVRNDFEQI